MERDPRIDAAGAGEEVKDAVLATDLGPPSADRGAPGHDLARAKARRIQALELKLSGMTYQAIADEMGYTDKSQPQNLIQRALDHVEARQVDELRDIEGARLDRLNRVAWSILLDAKTTPETRLKAVGQALRVSERRSRLYGLDAPVKVAIDQGAQAELEDALALLRDVVLGEVTGSSVEPVGGGDTRSG